VLDAATRVQHKTIKANETCRTKEGLKDFERAFFRSSIEQNVSCPVVPLRWTSAIGWMASFQPSYDADIL